MSDEWKTPEDARPNPWLGRIADALGVPTSRFYADGGELEANSQFSLDDAAVLALVHAYLQAADSTTRRQFVKSVTAFVDQLPP